MSQSNLTNFFEKLGPISSRTSPEKKNSINDIVEHSAENVVEEIPAEASQEPAAKKKRKRNRRNRKKGKQPEESSGSLVITVDESSRSSTDSNLLPEKTSPKGTAKTGQKIDPPKIEKSSKSVPKPTVQKQLTGAAKEKEEHQPKAKRTGSTTKDPSEKEWVIEAILKHRFVETTKIEYFIKWKDWPSSTNTWEPLEHMVNCQKMIDDYHGTD